MRVFMRCAIDSESFSLKRNTLNIRDGDRSSRLPQGSARTGVQYGHGNTVQMGGEESLVCGRFL